MGHTFNILTPTIDGFDNSFSNYLYSFFVAVKRVNINYIKYTYLGTNIDPKTLPDQSLEDYKVDIGHVERVFAYELYRQWYNQDLITHNPNLIINAEIPKELIAEVLNSDKHLYYPDMVLHAGQQTCDSNILVCEIKRKEYANLHPEKLNDDIKKLYLFVDKKTNTSKKKPKWKPYEIGVFLMTVKELKNDEKYSLNLISELFDETIFSLNKGKRHSTKKIICAIYDGKELLYDTLCNLIKQAKKSKKLISKSL